MLTPVKSGLLLAVVIVATACGGGKPNNTTTEPSSQSYPPQNPGAQNESDSTTVTPSTPATATGQPDSTK